MPVIGSSGNCLSQQKIELANVVKKLNFREIETEKKRTKKKEEARHRFVLTSFSIVFFVTGWFVCLSFTALDQYFNNKKTYPAVNVVGRT